ncbi:tRNA (adenosine(37)-N6)-dimethylallyltransferase MiaA [Manganibacter manganicus]|uniref:tRNA dimethylallyltransferase n=1 Tax=Manganibacter manganicus TaxID=1873176 RepID=A0A1V8RW30_9HYPH|nr:tRNA (adenosine(37)-N6)-dimethylallyltransferase MiaA [Pseudaminobacter manganicus]OQM77397.1 tRNA (adenosine(37)-N6)-dimethylallyltransferase MiaA [Pseudaminobacter manganicus]
MSVATSGIERSGSKAGARRLEGAILIAGPTASGKSALALAIAERNGGVIVNADSMQVYSVLHVLTARPGAEELARASHWLYGHVDPAQAYSTGMWLRDVERLVGNGAISGRPVIFVGGTGLYFRALVEGIAEMPDIPAVIRNRWRAALHQKGAAALHEMLSLRDPAAGEQLRPTDGQRIVRALEVIDVSGRSILDWQAGVGRPLIDGLSARFIVVEPDRSELVARIEKRFDMMMEQGAFAEAERLGALGLDPMLPAMKAIGVRELLAAQMGKMTLDEAVQRAKTATRQYAKRQTTWFRHQLGPQWQRIAKAENGLKEA